MIMAMTDESNVIVRITTQCEAETPKAQFLDELYQIMYRAMESGIADSTEIHKMLDVAAKLSRKGASREN